MSDTTKARMKHFNTIVTYRPIPDTDSLNCNPLDSTLLSEDPIIRFNRKTSRLTIKGKDVNLRQRVHYFSVEEL